MKEIVFVTHNNGKVKSAEKYFKDLKIITYEYERDELNKVLESYDVV